MSQWSEFYRDRMNDRYRAHVAQKYGFLAEMVAKLSNGSRMVAEMGCGAGNISRIVAQQLPIHHLLTDRCPEMLKLARENMQGEEAMTLQHDLLSDDYSDIAGLRPKVIHGHGVLEHFSDEQIRHIIGKQVSCAKFVLHYVPTHKYKTPSFGDERLMTPMDWQRIARPQLSMQFNDGYDLLLGWKNE